MDPSPMMGKCSVVPSTSTSSFFHVHSRLYLTLQGQEEASKHSECELGTKHLVVPFSTSNFKGIVECADVGFVPCALDEIYLFDQRISSLATMNPARRIVICTGRDPLLQIRAAFLLGCHMIMTHGIGFEETHLAFKNLHPIFESYHSSSGSVVSVQTCWRAFCGAKCMRWIDFQDPSNADDKFRIHLEEYMHYSSHINGHIFTIIPGKLVLFRAPSSDLPKDKSWMDKDGMRFFGPEFYTEIFRDMGITTIVRLDSSPYDPATFEKAGFDTYSIADLGCAPATSDSGTAGPACLLPAMDGFLALAMQSRGCVAVHCDGHMDMAATLIAAFALHARHFTSPAEAAGWIRIATGAAVNVDMKALAKECRISSSCATRRAPSGGVAHSSPARVCPGPCEPPRRPDGVGADPRDNLNSVSASPGPDTPHLISSRSGGGVGARTDGCSTGSADNHQDDPGSPSSCSPSGPSRRWHDGLFSTLQLFWA